VKIVIITNIDNHALEMAMSLFKKETDIRIVLLSDAVYLINNMEENHSNIIYALEEDLDKRINKYPAWINPLNYGDFIDFIMAEGVNIINL